ncbi:MAG TPA: winged helix-turn-helix domain-containing protein [Gaiellaceae bacterium]|nr:winged helix-turn-helix domain-containing protein [Gaiellaceae bacterium]
MATRIADLSRRRGTGRLVGRDEQLAALTALPEPDPPALIAFVHGIAGIGKTALLRAFTVEAEERGARVVELDCRTIEPTERGFLQALGDRLDLDSDERVVVTLDNYEVFRLLDTWLRQEFVPSLPDAARVVFSGREPPVAAWLTAPELDGLVSTVPLGPLANEDAERLLRDLGVSERVNRTLRGHPLAIKLAAATLREGDELEDVAAQEAVGALARLYLADVEPDTRRALEAASVVRRVTRSLMEAMLGDETAVDALSELPFVEARADGLVVHDAVRAAIDASFRGTDPERHRAYRRAAWRQLREEVRQAAESELWRYTADMLFIIENPIVREAFFPSAMQPLAVEAARPEDAKAIERIVSRHEGPEEGALIAAWWAEAPETFSVVRDREGIVTAFFILLDNATMLPPAVEDPVVRQWVEHLRDERIPRGEPLLGLRRWLDIDHGESPCASQAACWLDVKRTYMQLRPDLRRIYVTVTGVPTYWPTVEKLGFRPTAETPAELDGTGYASVFLDFGPGSVDGWLAGLVAAELGLEARLRLDETANEVFVEGRPISLTPLEFGVLAQLERADGRAVTRRELLESVWGTSFTGGSNVVDAAVHSLREKLGAEAEMVQTVRSVGYRLRA